jgi:hypothetical protein
MPTVVVTQGAGAVLATLLQEAAHGIADTRSKTPMPGRISIGDARPLPAEWPGNLDLKQVGRAFIPSGQGQRTRSFVGRPAIQLVSIPHLSGRLGD